MKLSDSVDSLKMVGPAYAKRLQKLNILTIEDLLHHYPSRYLDFSKTSKISNLNIGDIVTVRGQIISCQNIKTRRGLTMQKLRLQDSTGILPITWFNQPFITNVLKLGIKASLAGKIETFQGQPTLTNPEYELLQGQSLKHTGKLIPIYPQTHGLSSKWLRSRIAPILKFKNFLYDFLPQDIKINNKLLNLEKALSQIHFPQNSTSLKSAQTRLKFDELFLLQLAAQKRKHAWLKKTLAHSLSIDQEKISQLISHLPFTLTSGQNLSLKQILKDLSKPHPMNRLLQGDVGSGKTVVAACAMYASFLNGLTSILMAPTQILADQHFNTLKTVFAGTGIKLKLVTSATKTENRKLKTDIYVGTHALLFNHTPKNLGLLVIDEQHRFGVKQRSLLLENPVTPHLLSMTATPIPRSIALTAFADLDLSIIKKLPKGRKPIKTWVVPKTKTAAAYDWVAKQIKAHKTQAFIVCPLIDESESAALTQVKAAKNHFDYLKTQVYPQLKLGLLHGKLKTTEKTKVLDKFQKQKIDILVTTPVIEVGIDMPNASIMLIEGSQRFGLAQLHQLRGRVGRGNQKAYCLAFTTSQEKQDLTRLKALETHHNGFDLAQLDLKLRGPGQLYGTAQHGFYRLKIASFSDTNLIKKTHSAANQLIKKDPELSNYPLLYQKLQAILGTHTHPN